MIKVSIIVPVHNSESYLHKCVDSLLAQTLEEIQIILVDDCSADASREIIADYANRHPDKILPLYLDENVRQGGARNRGMEIARGEYIAFVDSDDFVEPEMCRVLYEIADGADMCGADYYIDSGEKLTDVSVSYGEGEMNISRKAVFVSNSGYFWSRIYKRSFLEEFNLKFPENVYYEDAYFNFMTALYSRSAVKASGQFYHYYQSENSTMRSFGKPHQYERIKIPSLILEECKKRGIYQPYKALIDYKYIMMQMGNIRFTCLGQFEKPDVTQLDRIRQAINAQCPDFRKNPYYSGVSFQLRCYLWLTLKSPKLAVMAYKVDWLIDILAVIYAKLKGKK